MDPSLISFLFFPSATRHTCAMWHKIHRDSEVVPSTPLPSLTCRNYVCVCTSGSVFTLPPSLPHPISSSLLISWSPPPTPPLPPLSSSQCCGLLLSLSTQQSANGLSGCSVASSRRPSSATVSWPRAAGVQRQCPAVWRLLQHTWCECARPLSALIRPWAKKRGGGWRG